MKLKPISNDLCQVYFFEEDLDRYKIGRFEEISTGNPAFEQALTDAIDTAENEIGFAAKGRRIEISAYPTGERIFYLTIRILSDVHIICRLKDFEDVIMLCRSLRKSTSARLLHDGEVYYLDICTGGQEAKNINSLISEFGELVTEAEGAKLVCEDAMDTIKSFF
ncbi:MAG: hypothetical protein Q8865_01655 [Bacillota bacterium]|nr:hypothetical protein [Bacillota bacterium]